MHQSEFKPSPIVVGQVAVTFTFRMTPSMKEFIEREAWKVRRSQGDYLRFVLEKHKETVETNASESNTGETTNASEINQPT